ncbi:MULTISPECIES: sulfite exporter TauE/SafE family protein [unclassified Aureimonas]|uniref:sulfite exporter TauE/SafE family protein n=1 Tax=unclassified Aureimonas TaxID=2615206 RepID=UPI0006FEA8D5|nr:MULTISPECIES: sulfite exporter TauE/SafE family protein [unclassified Aureimonas]KQT55129.1 permease [Aureimonas sp. Leaf427]KQT70918.1 permease [Aureimonas sp. Leaf460]
MNLYLPIAEISVNMLVLIGMGAAVGFLSGMFGVGGGFLITPLLIFYNIPPAVAVATGGNQVIAASFSGALAHYKRGTIDLKLGGMLLAGGAAGSLVGVLIFTWLRRLGQLDLVVSLLYVVFLGLIGGLMLVESINAMRRVGTGGSGEVRKHGQHNWVHRLPLKMRFQRSKLYVSAIPVLGIGFFIGILSAVMGVGGGFIMVPAMIYLLRVPTSVVIGTSLFQIIFTAAATTIMQAATNQTVDVVLAFLLMIGGVVGAQFGAEAGRKLRGEQLRALLALLVLAVCLRLGVELVIYPADLFSISLPSGAVR